MNRRPTFGEWLRQMRQARGFSMRDLAERAELTQPAISQYEQGSRNPSRPVVVRLAQALAVEAGPGLRAAGFLPDEDETKTAAPSVPEITYEPDPELASVLEQYESLDDDGREIARESFRAAVEAAFRRGRRRDTPSFGADRYGTDQHKDDAATVRELTPEEIARRYGGTSGGSRDNAG